MNTIAITPKSEDKYVVKVFNPSEFHFSEVTFFQIWYFSVSFQGWWCARHDSFLALGAMDNNVNEEKEEENSHLSSKAQWGVFYRFTFVIINKFSLNLMLVLVCRVGDGHGTSRFSCGGHGQCCQQREGGWEQLPQLQGTVGRFLQIYICHNQ